MQQHRQPDFYQWAIELRELGEPIGSISVVELLKEVGSAEIGYCIGKGWWRQGIMSEALAAVIDYLFAEVGALRICAKHDARNPNSGRVMLHCGMTHEGTVIIPCIAGGFECMLYLASLAKVGRSHDAGQHAGGKEHALGTREAA
ncbi:MAG: GNAT family N-acetyltransferase [Atopobiaceae bacterium]|nr:GNAT family N-acetyltransferase [Atopobiaceae bacterium]